LSLHSSRWFCFLYLPPSLEVHSGLAPLALTVAPPFLEIGSAISLFRNWFFHSSNPPPGSITAVCIPSLLRSAHSMFFLGRNVLVSPSPKRPHCGGILAPAAGKAAKCAPHPPRSVFLKLFVFCNRVTRLFWFPPFPFWDRIFLSMRPHPGSLGQFTSTD